jgi:hypothetical protein
MPNYRDILQFLNERSAARLGATSRDARNLARYRLAPIRPRRTMAAIQAAKIGKARYKADKKSQNLNKIYKSLEAIGILNMLEDYNRNNALNNYINLYGNLRNQSMKRKEQVRLQHKMFKWKSTLVRELLKRNRIQRELYNRNMSSPNYNW